MPGVTEVCSSKVPEVTLAFWIIKIAATMAGVTATRKVCRPIRHAGSLLWPHLGLTRDPAFWEIGLNTGIFFVFFIATVVVQVRSKSFHPFLYWSVIVATMTAGTTMADFADRSLGIGYVGGSLILFAILMLVLGLWRFSAGTISVANITSPKAEMFYWTTILFSNTLGTALGDFFADDSGLGYEGGALVFAAALAIISAAYSVMKMSHTLLFWMAFILARPLGATVGDLLTKERANGGLDLSRISSSLLIAIFMICSILFTSQRSGSHPGARSET